MLLKNLLTPGNPVVNAITSSKKGVVISLLGGSSSRQRVEIAPLYIPLVDGQLWEVFVRAGQIIADPNDEDPESPVGHCFESHLPRETERWPISESEPWYGYARLIEAARQGFFSWQFLYNDGESKYYKGESDPNMRKQVSNRTGRTMIGVLIPHVLCLYGVTPDPLRIDFQIQYRLLVDDGDDSSYSSKGTTELAFGGFRNFI